jgi:hypothetical protein
VSALTRLVLGFLVLSESLALAAAAGGAPGPSLSVTPLRTTIVSGEPLCIEVALKWTSENDPEFEIVVNKNAYPLMGVFFCTPHVEVVPAWKFRPSTTGKEREFQFFCVIWVDSKHSLLLATPGRHEVAVVETTATLRRSVDVTVNAASPEEKQLADVFCSAQGIRELLRSGEPVAPDDIAAVAKEYERVMVSSPKSVFAPFMSVIVGKNRADQLRRQRQWPAEECQEVASLLARGRELRRSLFDELSLFQGAFCLGKAGKFDSALQLAKELQREYGDEPRVCPRLRDMIAELERLREKRR